MAAHISRPQRALCAVDALADVAADAGQPEVRVTDAVEPIQALALARRVELEVEDRGHRRPLLLSGAAGQARMKAVGDEEVHHCPTIVK